MVLLFVQKDPIRRWCKIGIRVAQAVLVMAGMPCFVHAGLYCAQERYAELPAAWKGFLADQRVLRLIGAPPSPQTPPSALRQEYTLAVERLQAAATSRALTADESAELGALLIRLGKVDAALAVLRPAANQYPQSFLLQAHLGTAWQLSGNLNLAAEHLRQAVVLAPESVKPLEQLHLRLVRSRLRPGAANGVDALFEVQFTDDQGHHKRGRLTAEELARLPKNAIAMTQQLALWFPSDGKLIWQLAELSCVQGDLATAQMLLDLCVGEFGLSDPPLRKARQAVREALVARGQAPIGQTSQQEAHAAHGKAAPVVFKSRRALLPRPLDLKNLPEVKPGQNHFASWQLLAETGLDHRRFAPKYHPYLLKLEGERVTLTGFMQPLTDDLECTSFVLVENPIGCWYCEMPDITGIAFASLEPGQTTRFTRNVIKVTGKLKLNRDDPEEFLFTLTEAKVAPVE